MDSDLASFADVFERTVAAHRAGRRDEAEDGYARLLVVDPARPEVNANLGLLLFDMGRQDDGLGRLAVAAKASSSSQIWKLFANAMAVVGQSRLNGGDPDSALRMFRGAIALEPGFVPVYCELCRVLLAEGSAEALSVAERTAALAPEDPSGAARMEMARLVALFRQQTRSMLALDLATAPPAVDRVAGTIAGRLIRLCSYYDGAISLFGASPKGVSITDDHHAVSLEVMRDFLPARGGEWTVNDLGCGYGALFGMIRDRLEPYGVRYHGFDISPRMLAKARERYGADPRAVFALSSIPLWTADYSIAVGTFNLNFECDPEDWMTYLKAQILLLAKRSRIAFSFNALLPEHGMLFRLRPEQITQFIRERISENIDVLTGYSRTREWTVRVYL
jgi:SAM-dependent methyltransferase